MMQIHGGYYTPPPPLTYHEEIYWPEPALFSEYRISWHVLHDAAFDARKYVDEELRIAGAREVAKQNVGWLRYVIVPSERTEDYGDLIVRHTIYEQPGYAEIKLFRAPSGWTTFRKMDDQHNVVDVPLRRLMYHGERVRGALHDGVLYVVS